MAASKQVYRINDAQLQYILNSISDRLDKIEGWRGTPEFQADVDLNDNKLTGVAQGSENDDAAIRNELTLQDLETSSSPTFAGLTLTGLLTGTAITITGTFTTSGTIASSGAVNLTGALTITNAVFKWVDTNGVVIHQWGE